MPFDTFIRITRPMGIHLATLEGRSMLVRQVLETELRQRNRFERLALNLNSLCPEGSDERRLLEGVQAAMRGVR